MTETQLSAIAFCGALAIGIAIIGFIPSKMRIKEAEPEYQQTTPVADLKCLYKKYKGLPC